MARGFASQGRGLGVSGRAITQSVIPDSGLYLDDWADNKLSSRDSYETTLGDADTLEPDSSSFTNPSRPEWSFAQGSNATASSEQLTISASGNDEILEATSENGVEVWEIDLTKPSSNDWFAIFWPVGSNLSNFPNDDSGYRMVIDSSGGSLSFDRRDSGGTTSLISGSWDDDQQTHTYRLERDSSDQWELFYDGVSQGTATDSNYDGNNVALHNHNASGADMVCDNFRVF